MKLYYYFFSKKEYDESAEKYNFTLGNAVVFSEKPDKITPETSTIRELVESASAGINKVFGNLYDVSAGFAEFEDMALLFGVELVESKDLISALEADFEALSKFSDGKVYFCLYKGDDASELNNVWDHTCATEILSVSPYKDCCAKDEKVTDLLTSIVSSGCGGDFQFIAPGYYDITGIDIKNIKAAFEGSGLAFSKSRALFGLVNSKPDYKEDREAAKKAEEEEEARRSASWDGETVYFYFCTGSEYEENVTSKYSYTNAAVFLSVLSDSILTKSDFEEALFVALDNSCKSNFHNISEGVFDVNTTKEEFLDELKAAGLKAIESKDLFHSVD